MCEENENPDITANIANNNPPPSSPAQTSAAADPVVMELLRSLQQQLDEVKLENERMKEVEASLRNEMAKQQTELEENKQKLITQQIDSSTSASNQPLTPRYSTPTNKYPKTKTPGSVTNIVSFVEKMGEKSPPPLLPSKPPSNSSSSPSKPENYSGSQKTATTPLPPTTAPAANQTAALSNNLVPASSHATTPGTSAPEQLSTNNSSHPNINQTPMAPTIHPAPPPTFGGGYHHPGLYPPYAPPYMPMSQMPSASIPMQIPSVPITPAPMPMPPTSTAPHLQPMAQYAWPYPPISPPDSTKEMISAFKTIDMLVGEKLDFPSWKANIAAQLNSHSSWKDFLTSVSPPVFVPVLPMHLQSADTALFAAIKSRMDSDAKKLAPVGISSGLQLMAALTAACSPTLSVMSIIQLPGQLQNPRRRATENPQQYLFRLQELQ